VDGNIGYRAAGRLPVRKGWQGDVPVDGSSGRYEWEGWIPFGELPSAFNPPSGMIVSANQDPFPSGYPYTAGGNFAAPYRARQIRDMLAAKKGWRAAEMLAVQKDVYSSFHHYLARAVTAAWDRKRTGFESLAPAIDLLRPWNGQMDKDMAPPVIAALTYQHLRRAVAQCAAPGKGAGARWDPEVAPAVIERLLRTRPAGWFADWDRQLLTSLQDAVEEGRRTQGSDPGRWWYGRHMWLLVRHPVLANLPLFGKRYNLGPVAMSGSPTTVKQTSTLVGPSMRMVADTGDWERSLLNLVAGQSGQPLSGHYKDQWERYYAGESFPMQFAKVDAGKVLRLIPE
jgi:penicillin amidase